jgi:hypothetical protein
MLDELLKNYGAEIKSVLSDKKNQQALAIVGAVYLMSKNNKERNAVIAGLASLALLPDSTVASKK